MPPATARPRRAWPRRARATVVLPEPDSPTRPRTSPAVDGQNETSSTTSTRRIPRGNAQTVDDQPRASAISRHCVQRLPEEALLEALLLADAALHADGDARHGVGERVDADRRAGR